jgi:hypothetical protein
MTFTWLTGNAIADCHRIRGLFPTHNPTHNLLHHRTPHAQRRKIFFLRRERFIAVFLRVQIERLDFRVTPRLLRKSTATR